MKRRGRGFSYLFLVVQVAIPQPVLCDDILSKARAANENLYSSLQSFVCHERIERFRGPLNAETGRALDTVTANLSFENGVEHYSDVRQNARPRDGISNLTGAWSEGEFGTLLLQTETLLKTQPVFVPDSPSLCRSRRPAWAGAQAAAGGRVALRTVSIFRTVSRASPNCRAASRSLILSTTTARRTRAYSSTVYTSPVFHKHVGNVCWNQFPGGLVSSRRNAAHAAFTGLF